MPGPWIGVHRGSAYTVGGRLTGTGVRERSIICFRTTSQDVIERPWYKRPYKVRTDIHDNHVYTHVQS